MEFFDKLGKKATDVYKVTADKTGKIAKETKIKFKISDLKSQIDEIYEQIGKTIYEKHIREEEYSIEELIDELCTKIDVLSDEIDSLLHENLDLRDKKQCTNCYKEIDKEDNFCSNCGEKQNNEQPREVEILEDLENTEVEDDEQIDKQIVIEELENDIDEEQDNTQESNENDEDKCDNTTLQKTVAIESDIEVEQNEEDEEKDD